MRKEKILISKRQFKLKALCKMHNNDKSLIISALTMGQGPHNNVNDWDPITLPHETAQKL